MRERYKTEEKERERKGIQEQGYSCRASLPRDREKAINVPQVQTRYREPVQNARVSESDYVLLIHKAYTQDAQPKEKVTEARDGSRGTEMESASKLHKASCSIADVLFNS